MGVRLKSIFDKITHGVYLIAVADNGQSNAFTAAWVMQVSFDPLLVAFSINPGHFSYKLLRSGGHCTINVLELGRLDLAERFGRPDDRDKMSFCRWLEAESGVPILADALAYFECKVSHYCPAGDHEIVVCEVLSAAHLNDGVTMTYSDTGDMDGSSEIFPEHFC